MGQQLRNILIFIVALSASAPLQAQRGQGRAVGADVQVHVTYENDRPAGQQIRLDLTNETGIPITQTFTDSDGRAVFRVDSSGVYRVKASGLEIEDTVSDPIIVTETARSQIAYIRVKLKSQPNTVQSVSRSGTAPVTSAAQLRVPSDARKAFDKGLASWQKKDYEKAAAEFERAVALYPDYDTAYNNLGVMYAHLKQPDKAIAAFERSVQLNDKNADADRNLARMLMHQKNFARAEDLLKKSLSVQPLDPGSLTMLSIAEIENGKLDEALTDARKVHDLPHDGYAVSHFIAGQALERKHQPQDAAAEYMVYLRESPNGPEVAQVKSALDRLNGASSRSNAQ
jgi:tetratricopeptide (TPR) repeat protein